MQVDLIDKINLFWRGRWGDMNQRERYFVYAAGAVIGLLLLSQLMVLPATWKKEALTQLEGRQRELQDMRALQKEYNALKGTTGNRFLAASRRDKNFTLFSFLDRLSGQAGVKGNITYMKPSTAEVAQGNYTLSIVEVKLESVSLHDLTSYLYMIETSKKAVFVKRLSVSQNEGDQAGVDAIMQVQTVKG